MTADRALARLRDPEHPALGQLAQVALDVLGAQPVHALLDTERLAHHAAAGLRSAARAPNGRQALIDRLDAERARWAHETRTGGDVLPTEADAVLRALLGQPWVPSEDLTYKVINHDAVRTLVREVLQGALSRFVDRIRHLDQGSLGGVGSKVMRRSKGLFGGVAGNLGAAAEGLMGAVRDELGAGLESRIRDTLGGATDEAIRAIAAWVADPAHAEPVAALRLSVLDVMLAVPAGELVRELDEVPTAALVDAIWDGLQQSAARDDLHVAMQTALDRAIQPWRDETLAAWLDDLDLGPTAREAAAEAVDPWARTLVQSDAFGTWWSQLFS